MKTIFDIAVELELKGMKHEICKKDRTIYIPNIVGCKIIIKECQEPNIFFVNCLDHWELELPYKNVITQVEQDYNSFMAVEKHNPNTDTQEKIAALLDSMKDLLLYKNQKYGDSALKPKKIFYKGDSTNSILIRLDDKLGRVMSNTEEKPRVNDVADIIGYCTLLMISMGVTPEDIAKFKD